MKNTELKNNKFMNAMIEAMKRSTDDMFSGAVKLAREYITSTDRYNMNEIMIGNNLSYFDNQDEARQAVNVMKIAKLKSFLLVDHGTPLMDEIHYFINAGAKFGEPVEIEAVNKWNEKENIKGIRFTL